MEKKRLEQLLTELHRSLSGDAGELDPETRKLLDTVTSDIQRLVEHDSDVTKEQIEPVRSELRNLLLRFETEHPHVTSLIGRIADGLAALGI